MNVRVEQRHYWLAAATAAVLLLRASLPGPAQAGSIEDDAEARVRSVENKLRLLDRLVNNSSTAQRLQGSEEAGAHAALAEARSALRLARADLAGGATARAETRVNEALQRVSRASRAVVDRVAAHQAAREDYRTGHERVVLFLDALARAWEENGYDEAGRTDKMRRLRGALAAARERAADNDHEGANRVLRELSAAVERALSEARRNQTLLHELKFASPEQELAYELERNRSFVLLLRALAAQTGGETRAGYLEQLDERNSTSRAEARSLAAAGEVIEAIGRLEQASNRLAAALRTLGLGF